MQTVLSIVLSLLAPGRSPAGLLLVVAVLLTGNPTL